MTKTTNDNEAPPIEVNSPFDRVPSCACDKGTGDPPAKLFMLECKARGGPCAENYYDNHPEALCPKK